MLERVLSDEDRRAVEKYFDEWWSWVATAAADGGVGLARWKKVEPAPPIAAVQAAALHHENAKTRSACLSVLDHWANDESASVFRVALSDPVPKVRLQALHGLSCERCRTGELCLADVVPTLLDALSSDPSPKVRHTAVITLVHIGAAPSAATALTAAAEHDPDPLVRRVALAALEGRRRDLGSRKTLRRRDARAAATV